MEGPAAGGTPPCALQSHPPRSHLLVDVVVVRYKHVALRRGGDNRDDRGWAREGRWRRRRRRQRRQRRQRRLAAAGAAAAAAPAGATSTAAVPPATAHIEAFADFGEAVAALALGARAVRAARSFLAAALALQGAAGAAGNRNDAAPGGYRYSRRCRGTSVGLTQQLPHTQGCCRRLAAAAAAALPPTASLPRLPSHQPCGWSAQPGQRPSQIGTRPPRPTPTCAHPPGYLNHPNPHFWHTGTSVSGLHSAQPRTGQGSQLPLTSRRPTARQRRHTAGLPSQLSQNLLCRHCGQRGWGWGWEWGGVQDRGGVRRRRNWASGQAGVAILPGPALQGLSSARRRRASTAPSFGRLTTPRRHWAASVPARAKQGPPLPSPHTLKHLPLTLPKPGRQPLGHVPSRRQPALHPTHCERRGEVRCVRPWVRAGGDCRLHHRRTPIASRVQLLPPSSRRSTSSHAATPLLQLVGPPPQPPPPSMQRTCMQRPWKSGTHPSLHVLHRPGVSGHSRQLRSLQRSQQFSHSLSRVPAARRGQAGKRVGTRQCSGPLRSPQGLAAVVPQNLIESRASCRLEGSLAVWVTLGQSRGDAAVPPRHALQGAFACSCSAAALALLRSPGRNLHPAPPPQPKLGLAAPPHLCTLCTWRRASRSGTARNP